jgi:hypothetical protein
MTLKSRRHKLKGKIIYCFIKFYKHYVDNACNIKKQLYKLTKGSYTILICYALEQYLNTPFSGMLNSDESIWSDPGGSKFTCIMHTQDNVDIIFTGDQAQRTDCSTIITNVTRNTVKLPTSFPTPKDNDICPEAIWIIWFKIKFVMSTNYYTSHVI